MMLFLFYFKDCKKKYLVTGDWSLFCLQRDSNPGSRELYPLCHPLTIGPKHFSKGTTLTFTTLWAYLADDKLVIFFLFIPETGFYISCKYVTIYTMYTSKLVTIFIQCQILFSGKHKKTISKCRLLIFFTQSAKR